MRVANKPVAAAAVWDTSKGLAADERKKTGRRRTATKATHKPAAALPDFIEPQLCTAVERPPAEVGWGHEIKFDGYRIQMCVSAGAVTLKTRKGLDWAAKFEAIAGAAAHLPDVIIDGEIVALDDHGAPDFASLQAAISEQKTDDLVFFAFDLLFDGDKDLRGLPLAGRKTQLQGLLAANAPAPMGLIRFCRTFRDGRRCRSEIGLPAVARRHRVEAPRCALRVGSNRFLGEVQMPRRP